MGRVRKVSGEDVVTEDEFAAWWSEQHEGDFHHVFRRYLAARLQLKNFRQLALVRGDEMLSQDSHWIDAELVVVIRPYLEDTDGEYWERLLLAAGSGDAAAVASLLEMPLDPDSGFDNELLEPDEIEYEDEDAQVAPIRLLKQALCLHVEVVRCLLAGASANARVMVVDAVQCLLLPRVGMWKLFVACWTPTPRRTRTIVLDGPQCSLLP